MDRGLGIRTPDQGTDCSEMILDRKTAEDKDEKNSDILVDIEMV